MRILFGVVILFSLVGCSKIADQSFVVPESARLPENLEFYVKPKKDFYLPYERVELNLWVKNRGTFQKDINISSKELSFIKLTPLTTSNSQYTYHVNWADIHRNEHGHNGKTTRIAWYLPNDWAGLISQVPGAYRVKFNLSTPLGNWETEEFQFNLHVPAEERLPYDELLRSRCNLFLEYEFAVRAYEKNWSTFKQCPTDKLPFDELEKFVAAYPYSAFTQLLMQKLERTQRIIKNPYTKYDVEDMGAVERILALKK